MIADAVVSDAMDAIDANTMNANTMDANTMVLQEYRYLSLLGSVWTSMDMLRCQVSACLGLAGRVVFSL